MKTESYAEHQAKLKEDQEGLTKDEVMQSLRAEYKLDLDNMPSQTHNWVKRGIKVSCEGGAHPHHSHFLVNRR